MNKINIKDSQNFLHSKVLVESLVKNCGITKEDSVIEIGPGKGIITHSLSFIAHKVIAIELDAEFYINLKKQYANTNIELINGDFLNYKLPKYPYKVFSNIPFNITANIINKLFEDKNSPVSAHIIMQYEAFLKYAGQPYFKESYKSLLYKPMYATKIEHKFKKEDFKPTPNANIIMASFIKKENPDISLLDYELWKDFVAYMFLEKGISLKEKTKKIFSYNQLKFIAKEAKISDNDVITSWEYTQWLSLFNSFNSYLVSKEKKQLVIGSYYIMKKNEDRIVKVHRNRKSENWSHSVKNKTKKYK